MSIHERAPRLSFSILAGLILLSAACSTIGASSAPREYLDEATAATITTVDAPIVLARERRELAANARDYVTLAAAAVNRTGHVDYFIVAWTWSTVDRRLDPDRGSDGDSLVIEADDRRIVLARPERSAHDVGIDRPVFPPPGAVATAHVYRTDLVTLRYLAAARRLSVRGGTGDLAPTYEVWDDRRAALDSFVRFMNGRTPAAH